VHSSHRLDTRSAGRFARYAGGRHRRAQGARRTVPAGALLPTGGIGEENFLDCLKLPNVASVGRPAADIRAGNWPAIIARARRAVEMVGQVGR
jgi:2-keto-3-deoxy-6-phosphogluconate aldolase